MKMTLYVFCQLIDLIKADQLQSDPITGVKAKGKNKGKEEDWDWDWDWNWDWEKERLRVVTLLNNLVQLRVSQLFDPPTIEEEVVNLIAGSCFKVGLLLLMLLALHSRCWRTPVSPISESRTPGPGLSR